MNKTFRISLGEGEARNLENLMDFDGKDTPQEEIRFLITEAAKRHALASMRYSPKISNRTLSAEARVAKIAEMEKMEPVALRDELFALGLFDKVSWEDPGFRGVTQSYEVREENGEKVLGVLYEYSNGAKPNWSIVYTWPEILKELTKKRLI